MKRCWALMLLAACVVPGCAQQPRVRVAVASLFHPTKLEVENTSAAPFSVTGCGMEFALAPTDRAHIRLQRQGSRLTLQLRQHTIVCDSATFSPLERGDADLRLSIPGRFTRLYRGQLTLRAEPRELRAVVTMGLETAVASAVTAEAPPNALLEALKAQAIVSRSFYVAGAPRHTFAEFCDTTHCQFLRQPPPETSAAARATHETHGLVLTWQGQPFPALFSATCGGRTRTLAEAGLHSEGYPYFGVECPRCRHAATAAAIGPRVKAYSGTGAHPLTSPGGHGLGLCQMGAADMAARGSGFRQILLHYFPNTELRQQTLPPAP